MAAWDKDFSFDERAVSAERIYNSTTQEDWDLELPSGQMAVNDFEGMSHIIQGASHAEAPRSASLLEYLEACTMMEEKRVATLCVRPCVLFSRYVRHQQPGAANFVAGLWNLTFACSEENARFPKNNFHPLQAPESVPDMLVWLQSLCVKVSHTIAVVTRPSPAHGIDIVRERPPSEEVPLEKSLRVTEMAYCNRSWHSCGAHAKSIIRSLEKQSDGAVFRAAFFGDCFSGPSTFNDDLRSYQCTVRLARLVCRLLQHADERFAAGLPHTAAVPSGHSDPSTELAMPLNAGKLAALRRGVARLMNDIDDVVLRLKGKLVIDECLTHLALVHSRPTRTSICDQMGPRKNQPVACWCCALPPLPCPGLAGTFDIVLMLRHDLHVQAADEIEALVLADLCLEAMGHSPLTCERLARSESSDESKTTTFCWNSEMSHSHGPSRGNRIEPRLDYASGYIQGRLITLVALLPPSGHAHVKAALALGLSLAHLHGDELNDDANASFHLRYECNTLPRRQGLRYAEMLLFEATCALEQHTTTEPVDLPLHASSSFGPAPTGYSVLTCSMGYTTLRAFARALQQRAKDAFAVLVLDVCVGILRLRDDFKELRKLQRELCVASTLQGYSKTGAALSRYFLSNLGEECRIRTTQSVPQVSNGGVIFVQNHFQVIDSRLVSDVSDVLFIIELRVTQVGRSRDTSTFPHAWLRDLQAEFLGRQDLCLTTAAIHELRYSAQLAGLSAARTASKQRNCGCAMRYLNCALAACPTSSRRRISFLSYLVEASIFRSDGTGAHVFLQRINRLRKYVVSERGIHQQTWNIHGGEFCHALWNEPVKGRLMPLCQDSLDLGQFAAEVSLLQDNPGGALIQVAPTIAAVEAVVSRVGTARGLRLLGALYELRGRMQVSLSRKMKFVAFPLHIDDLEHSTRNCYYDGCLLTNEHLIESDDRSRCSQFWQHRFHTNATVPINNALRWYRHALECFKAADDLYGSARAASSFATLKLNMMFLEQVLAFPELRPSQGSITQNSELLRDVASASRHAIEIASIIDEPILLLEAYLNVAEFLQVCDDPVGAIAHWWEARELLFQLFVDIYFIPIVTLADTDTNLQLRHIIERLVRFLGTVADRDMMDENLILIYIFVLFERDSISNCPGIPSEACYQNQLFEEQGEKNLKSINDHVLWCWKSMVRIRTDIDCHTSGTIALSCLHHRNRNTLCELATTMQRIRAFNCIFASIETPTIFALHAAGSLILYAPQLGWRHTITFGRCGHGLGKSGATLVGAFAGVRRVIAERNGVDHRRSILKEISRVVALPFNFFSEALAADSKENFPATLMCSERAQILPWECISDIAFSRVLCKSCAVVASDIYKELLPRNVRRLIDLMIQDLSSYTTSHSRPDLLSLCEETATKNSVTSVSVFRVLPLSALHAPPVTPVRSHFKPQLFVPDPFLVRLGGSLLRCSNEADAASTAKAMAVDLALPVVHCPSGPNVRRRRARAQPPSQSYSSSWK